MLRNLEYVKNFLINPIFFIILFFFSNSVICIRINIPNDQPTVQAGIFAAQHGDTVLVSPGTYCESLNFPGKQIVVTNHFILNNDLLIIKNTIINGSSPAIPDAVSGVLFFTGEDSLSLPQGFTITGGIGTKWIDPGWTWRGDEGIFTIGSSPTIQGNITRYL